jgi:hypothetical protein
LKRAKKTFRFDTFGSEVFRGDRLQLHKAIAGENLSAANKSDLVEYLKGI